MIIMIIMTDKDENQNTTKIKTWAPIPTSRQNTTTKHHQQEI